MEELKKATGELTKLSDEPALRELETRVHEIYDTYLIVVRMCGEKMDTLKEWVQEIDDYERKVDDLNVWIDGRMSTLQSIGGVTAKFDIEMELQKLQVRVLCLIFIICKNTWC